MPKDERSELAERLVFATGALITATDGMEELRPQRQEAANVMEAVVDAITSDGIITGLASQIARGELESQAALCEHGHTDRMSLCNQCAAREIEGSAESQAGVVEALRGWQPIETCPEGTPVLVCSTKDVADGDYTIETMNVWINSDDVKHRFLNLNSGNYSRPDWWTHWMPLPEPPALSTPPA